jgi:hypothetical protein
MDNKTYKKSGELRGRKKDKAFIKLSKRKVRYNKTDENEEK